MPRQKSTSEKFGDAFAAASETAATKIPERMVLNQENEAIKKLTGKDLSGLPSELRNHYAQQLFNRNLELDDARASVPTDLRGDLPSNGNVDPKELAGITKGENYKEIKDLTNTATKEQTPQKQKTQPILNSQQIREAAANIVNDNAARGKAVRFEDALQQVRSQNQDAIADRTLQQDTAREGIAQFKKSFGEKFNFTPRIENYISKRIENARNSGLSEAEIAEMANEEGKHISNAFANIDKKIPPNRAKTRLYNFFTGKGRLAEKELQSTRNMIKPLLDAGLHDEVRERLGSDGLGYGAEEIETLISSLSESAEKKLHDLGQMPNAVENVLKNRKKPNEKNSRLSTARSGIDQVMSNARVPEEDRGRVTQTIGEILNANPSENLILLRKQMEEQGVDWRTFKDSLDDLMTNGQIRLPEEQNKFMGTLDEPPLSYLNDILYGLGLTGK